MCGRGVFAMGVMLVYLGSTNEVSTFPVPDPDPCLFRINLLHPTTTTTTTTTTTAAPSTSVAEAKSLSDMKETAMKEFEKLFESWASWGTTTTTTAAPQTPKFKTYNFDSSGAMRTFINFLIWPMDSIYPEITYN